MMLLAITLKDLLNPEFYINNGGLWVLLFIVFAETGLMVGFFLPGDSLLFVAGIFSQKLVDKLIPGGSGSDITDLLILLVLISLCGIIGNTLGYWLAKKAGLFFFIGKIIFYLRKDICTMLKSFTISMVARPSYSRDLFQSSGLLRPSLPA